MQNILIVGGAGYVGSHCARHLAAHGLQPIVYDDLSQGHRDFVRWGPLVKGDIRHSESLEAAFKQHQPQAVIHLAALTLVGDHARPVADYRDINVSGTEKLLAAMKSAGCSRLVYSSSCAVYGQPQADQLDEDHPLKPISTYGETKLEAEKLLWRAAADWGLDWIALRYFNAAGAAADAAIGEDHDPETHLIPRALGTLLGERTELKVFGENYETKDGTAVRDFVHVEDLAKGHHAALTYLSDGGRSRAINLGSGVGHSVLEVLQAIERVTGLKVPHSFAPPRPGDPARLVAGTDLAGDCLSWKAQCSLEQIIEDAWRWHSR